MTICTVRASITVSKSSLILCVAGPGTAVRIEGAVGSDTKDMTKKKRKEEKQPQKGSRVPLSIFPGKRNPESRDLMGLYAT